MRNKLVEDHLWVAKKVAGRMAAHLPRSVDVEDLRQVGAIGLIKAAESFDPSAGTPFSAYAQHRVKGAIRDYLRSLSWAPRLMRERSRRAHSAAEALTRELGRDPSAYEIADRTGLSLTDVAERHLVRVFEFDDIKLRNDSGTDYPHIEDRRFAGTTAVDNAIDNASAYNAVMAALSQRERTVISLYYGSGLTLAEIGTALKISASRVRQIRTRAIARLQKELT